MKKDMRPVSFINPKRKVRRFCQGFALNETRLKNGIQQTLVLFPLPSPKNMDGQKIWVNSIYVFDL